MIKAANFFVLALNSSLSLPFLIFGFASSPRHFVSAFCFLFSAFRFCLALDRVHESNFDVVKKDYPNEQDYGGKERAVTQICWIEGAGAKIGVTKRLDDRRHGVCEYEPAEAAASDHGQWVNNRRSIHHQLNAKPDQLLEVAITCSQRRNNNACPKAETCHEQK